MNNLSRESIPVLSQGSLDTVMNLAGDLETYLKSEWSGGDCLQEEPYISGDPEIFSLILPDSTEQIMTVPIISPVSTSALPSTEDYPGPCDFNVDLSKSSGDRAKWEYSKSLNKLFVVMDCKIPLKFKTNQTENGLVVRILPIFLAQDSFAEAVMRCPTHVSNQEKSNKDFYHVNHIIRCHHQHASYDENVESKRLSVVAPVDIPQPGSDWSTIVYSFMCKNSCGLGMNRRSTALIFTLERQNGEVIGRKLINIRICSCPRRDMMKEEQDLQVRKTGDQKIIEPSSGQKVKVLTKKPLKRISKELVSIRVTKNLIKVIREIILMNEKERELTEEEKICLEDCNKHLC